MPDVPSTDGTRRGGQARPRHEVRPRTGIRHAGATGGLPSVPSQVRTVLAWQGLVVVERASIAQSASAYVTMNLEPREGIDSTASRLARYLVKARPRPVRDDWAAFSFTSTQA